jgi:hypothetical protein
MPGHRTSPARSRSVKPRNSDRSFLQHQRVFNAFMATQKRNPGGRVNQKVFAWTAFTRFRCLETWSRPETPRPAAPLPPPPPVPREHPIRRLFHAISAMAGQARAARRFQPNIRTFPGKNLVKSVPYESECSGRCPAISPRDTPIIVLLGKNKNLLWIDTKKQHRIAQRPATSIRRGA